ncbi:bacterial Ig-like domain-containing protein [Carnobacterium divergens]|uniref:bacterial Ig-like domain-containing protein n=1 Tax=Carnobacterium divergens TaxID=2748 RepID=UPI0039AFF997
MKKKKIGLFMLALLITQSLSSSVSAFAVTTSEGTTEEAVSSEKEDSTKTENNQTETTLPKDEKAQEVPALSEEKTVETPIKEEAVPTTKAETPNTKAVITDEILSTMTITDMDGVEYSQQATNRILNSSPVTAKLKFVVEDKDYLPGSVYTMNLPAQLGYSDASGEVGGVGAAWSVDAASKTVSITFNQRVRDTEFTLNLKSYIATENNPLVTVDTPGQTKNQYKFDLYEEVDPIKYTENEYTFGLQGDIYYNLNRTLSGNQTLELTMAETPGALFGKEDKQFDVNSYDVDVNGTILPETKQKLTNGTDYILSEDTVTKTAITVPTMNQQKAYVVSINRTLSLESASAYDYFLSQQYPTTKVGSVTLLKTTAVDKAIEFTAKTSQSQKMINQKNFSQVHGASFQSKGNYYLTIYGNASQTKKGEKIVVNSKNGQEIQEYKLNARNAENQSVLITDYFDVSKEGSKVILTATKDSNLQISMDNVKMQLEEKDIELAVSTPVIGMDKEFILISDKYIQPISVLNPNNAETAWGNYDRNGAYFNRTSVNVEGSREAPIENVIINVKNPNYLTLREVTTVSSYKLNKDYTVSNTADGAVIKFTTPITNSITIPIGFNYVPDSLAKNKSIPVDTIPITMSADGYEQLDATVTTGSKQGSERTLQASGNQFLVNARNDSFDSLVVLTKVPQGADVIFDIYDVSNDMVDSIYPQYWDRGQYFDKPMNKSSVGYPTITFDEATNSYQFDFGKTSKRYIIEYKLANGWVDVSPIRVTGTTAEPLYNNQEMSATASVSNEAVAILSASQTEHATLKNVTSNSMTTKNIDDKTRKVINPVFDIAIKGVTNGGIDLNSIVIDGVPKDAYTVKQTATGVKISFNDYTLTENITIQYNTVSENPGRIYSETTISSDSLDLMKAERKTVASNVVVLKFSDGEAEGIVYLGKVQFHTVDAADKTLNIPNVHFELVDNLSGATSEFVTDSKGAYNIDAIMSGEYTLRVTEVPKGYVISEEYLTGKGIKLTKGSNLVEIPFNVDLTSVKAKDSTIFVGDHWQPGDNFVSATDVDGQSIDFDKLTVEGTVDTNNAGKYDVVYKNQSATDKATITVIEKQETLEVKKNSTLYVGDHWQAEDNFISATDQAGNALGINNLTVTGSVDTSKAGVYQVTYSHGSQSQTATITVKADQSSVVVKDSTLYVGDSWKAEDNFISATDREGQPISFDKVNVTGVADPTVKGKYEVSYTIDTEDFPIESSLTRVLQVKNKQLTNVATITVLEKEVPVKPEEPKEPIKPIEPEKPASGNQGNTEKNQVHISKPKQTQSETNFPQTGEKKSNYLVIIGVLIVVVALGGIILVRRSKREENK